MTAHDWFVEHRAAFATRALDQDEEQLFADHVTRCPECAAAVEAIRSDLRWLPMHVQPVAPPPGFTRRMVDGVLTPRRVPIWRRMGLPMALAASTVLALGLAWQARRGQQEMRTQLALVEQESIALRDTLSIMRQAARVLQASIDVGGTPAGLVIFADETSHRWKVVLHGLPVAPAGESYQFWFVCPDGMVRGAEVNPVAGEPVILTLGMPEGSGPVLGASLTMELRGAAGPPRGKELAHIDL